MRRGLLIALAVAALPIATAPAAADCRVPAELVQDDPPLPLVAQRLHDKQPITIVVIGGASTAGTAAADPRNESYPHRLEEVLRRRHPGVPITVLNRGVPRQTTAQMVERFARDVYPAAPALVIWETGTVDAVRGLELDDFAEALDNGIAALRAHHFDIMLMNMQYSRSTLSVIDFGPYVTALEETADLDNVYLFRRFEMMRYWSENGVFEFADVPKGRRGALAASVYGCLAQRLADAIDYGSR
jgi:lysophospholipase L1-like esterase